jgi:leader peptidase (prepilin peptidase)/N-methyltransferase
MPPYLIVAAVGLIFGSFLNVCIYRLPRNQSLVLPASRCPSCDNPIRPWDNIPVLSYLILGGRCRYCGQRISLRYPLVEALNAFLYSTVIWRYGFGWDSALYCLLISALIVITFIDLDFQIIPDRITLTGIPVGLLSGSFVLPDPFLRTSALGFKSSLIGGASGFLFYYLIAYLSIAIVKKEGMGGGDIKLMAMVGAFLGWKTVILTTFLGSVFGSIVGVAIMIGRGKAGSVQIPFGPYLALGAVISLFFGQEILTWYLH